MQTALGDALRRLGAAYRSARHAWHALTPRQHHAILNVAVGTAFAAFVCGPLGPTAVLAWTEQTVLNFRVSYFSIASLAPDVAYLDADDSSFFKWQYPAVTPRDKLCRLIDFAIRSGARAVVVDVDLSNRFPEVSPPSTSTSCDSEASPLSKPHEHVRANGDDILARYLHDYVRRCSSAQRSCAPVLVARRLQTVGLTNEKHPVQAGRPSFLEAETDGTSVVVWGSIEFATDRDGVVRHWRLWEPLCGRKPQAIPSLGLLAAWMYPPAPTPQEQRQRLDRLKRVLDDNFTPVCGSGVQRAAALTAASSHIVLEDANLASPIVLDARKPERTIIFRVRNEEGYGIGVRIAASLVTDPENGRPFHGDVLARKIVVIGSSATDSGDFHRTPVGRMPGSLLIVNEIEDLLHGHAVTEPPSPYRWALELGSVALASFLFLTCSLRIAFGLTAVLILSFTFAVFAIGNGFWLDPAAPLVGISLHESAEHGLVPLLRGLRRNIGRGLRWARHNFNGEPQELT